MGTDNLLSRAVEFAAQAHVGQVRKGSQLPYIIHPMEAATICATFTDDPEVIAAAVLHDVVEDTEVTLGELEARFGARVARLVAGVSEDKRRDRPAEETWEVRKAEAVAELRDADDPGVRMVCLGDKLSNLRSIQHDLQTLGDDLWLRFHQPDPARQAWYYRSLGELLEPELGDTEAWREYAALLDATFSPIDEDEGA